MAKVTRVQRQVVANTVDAGAIGRAQQPFQQAAGVFDAFAQRQERLDIASAKSEVAKANAEATRLMHQTYNSNRQQYEKDPMGGTEQFDSDMKENIASIGDQLTSDRAKQMFEKTSTELKTRYDTKRLNWADNQMKVNTVTNISDAAESYAGQSYEAGKSGDADAFQQIQTNTMDVLVAGAGAFAPSELEKLQESTRKSNSDNFIEGMMRNNPAEALVFLEGGVVDGVYTTKEIDQLKDLAKKRTESLIKQDAKLKKSEPLKWLNENGAPVPPINIEDALTFRDREEYISTQREANPDMFVPLLTSDEVTTLSDTMKRMNPDELTAMMINLDNNTSDEFVGDLSRQLFERQPVQGMALSISTEAPDVSRNMIRGQAIIDNKVIKLPPDNDFIAQANEFIGSGISDPRLIAQVRDSAKAYYATALFDTGAESTDVIDPDQYKEAMKQTIGDTAEINDAKTFTFRDRNRIVVEADDFEDRFDDLEDADFLDTRQPFPIVGGEPIDAEFIKEWGTLVSVGDGVYNIHLKTTNQYAVDADGNPYVFNFKEIYNK